MTVPTEQTTKYSHLKTFAMFLLMGAYGGVYDIFFTNISYLLVLLTTAVLLIVNGTRFVKKESLQLVLGIILLCLISSILTSTNITSYIGLIGKTILTMFTLAAFKYDLSDIKIHIYKALKIIAIFALINAVLINIAYPLYTPTTSPSGYYTRTIGYIFNTSAPFELLGLQMTRNPGMFWEPGVLQIHINILIYCMLFEYNITNKQKYIIPLIVLLSTGSTTGFMILSMQLLFKFKNTLSLKTNNKGAKILGFITLFAILSPIVINEINHKLFTKNVSATVRMYDFYMGALIVSENPTLGIGLDPAKYHKMIDNRSITIGDQDLDQARGNTNAWLSILIYFGIFIGTYVASLIARQNLFTGNKLVFFIIMLLALFSEPLIVAYFNLLLIFTANKIFRSNLLHKNTT